MLCDETTHRLKAVIEALRMNPDRYAVIYDSKYDRDDSVSKVVVLQLHQYYLPVLPILSLRPLVIIQYLISFFYKEYGTICGWKIEPVV
jgi:hypothetical protein